MAQGFNLQSFIISVVIVGVTLVIGIYITSQMQTVMLTSAGAATNASNAAGSVVTALSTGTSWISILVVVGFATIILTMLTSGLGNAANETGTPYY
jgi:hypothetical protein